MYVVLTLFVVLAYGDHARSEEFCKLDVDSKVQYCFDPASAYGLRRCSSYEPTDVIHRPGCNALTQNSNNSVPAPKICNNGKWEDVPACSRVAEPGCIWKGVIGKCVNIYRCLSAAEHIFEMEKPPTCGYEDDEPMICCTDCALVNDTRKMLFNKRVGFLYKNGGKAHDQCIDYINELDYPCSTGGEKRIEWELDNRMKCYKPVERESSRNLSPSKASSTKRIDFPHLALIGYGSKVSSLQWLCGGSLISKNFILTAAKCAISPSDPPTYVALGMERLIESPDDNWQRYKVKTVIIHPNYIPFTSAEYNDIALLETKKPVIFNGVRPACLHVDGELDDVATVVAAGSVLAKKNLGDTPLPVRQDKLSHEECLVNFTPARSNINFTKQLCYGDRMGVQATCTGDTGGPLQSREHYPGRCVFTILGVLSIAHLMCRIRDFPETIHTNVQIYVPWIESIVWP